MDGHILAEDVVIANLDHARGFPAEGKILGIAPDDGPVAYQVALTHADMSGDHRPGLDPACFADHGTRLNNDTRTHLNIVGKGGRWVDKGCGVDQGHLGNYEG
jgi:hypothetical protein